MNKKDEEINKWLEEQRIVDAQVIITKDGKETDFLERGGEKFMQSNKFCRGLVESFYDIQKVRIAIEGQLRAYLQDVSEQEEVFMKEQVLRQMYIIEKDITKYLKDWVESIPLYDKWLKDVKGISTILSAGLFAWLGTHPGKDFATISKLWAYCGLAAGYVKGECEKGHKFIKTTLPTKCPVFKNFKGDKCGAKVKLIEKVEGKIPKRQRGWTLFQNKRLKCHAYKIGESFVKNGAGYRDLYDQFRTEYDTKWQTPEDCGSKGCKSKGKGKCMKGHRYAAAKRKMVKVFLGHFWMKSRELESLPIEHPFAVGRVINGKKHEHLIEIIEK